MRTCLTLCLQHKQSPAPPLHPTPILLPCGRDINQIISIQLWHDGILKTECLSKHDLLTVKIMTGRGICMCLLRLEKNLTLQCLLEKILIYYFFNAGEKNSCLLLRQVGYLFWVHVEENARQEWKLESGCMYHLSLFIRFLDTKKAGLTADGYKWPFFIVRGFECKSYIGRIAYCNCSERKLHFLNPFFFCLVIILIEFELF